MRLAKARKRRRGFVTPAAIHIRVSVTSFSTISPTAYSIVAAAAGYPLQFPLQCSSTSSQGVSTCLKNGAPGQTRTGDPLLRRQTLYPTELRAHPWLLDSFYCCYAAFSRSTFPEIIGALGATSTLGTVKPTPTRSASSRRRPSSNSIRE
jgi:hypothetical protein